MLEVLQTESHNVNANFNNKIFLYPFIEKNSRRCANARKVLRRSI